MIFNSFEFLIFLPIAFLLYWFVFRTHSWQNLLIVVASYVFYGWWDWKFLILIMFTSLCSFVSGLVISKLPPTHLRYRRAICCLNIIINIGILGIFKYYNFFIENLEYLFSLFGWNLDWITINVILPVGISFYTFQALSYTIDVYRGNIQATRNIIDFFAFISFFPQLVAGPIERATHLLPQFQTSRNFDYAKAVDGCRQMLWGFFKKMVIADNCATIVNQIWENYSDKTGLILLFGAVLFALQIYCDFSGYSDIAIGCSRLFGFDLTRNFNNPYFSRSIPDFWRRWHISLTTWFRDYIYFPLGGSRCGKWKIIRNIFIVWGISGLWHGANWTYVCWGLYHATLLSIYNLLGINTKHQDVISQDHLLPNKKEFLQMSITFLLAVIGWIIFRAENMNDAIHYISIICSNSLFNIPDTIAQIKYYFLPKIIMLAPFVMMISEWLQRDKQHALQISNIRIFKSRIMRWILYYGIIIIIVFYPNRNQTFIYFQF